MFVKKSKIELFQGYCTQGNPMDRHPWRHPQVIMQKPDIFNIGLGTCSLHLTPMDMHIKLKDDPFLSFPSYCCIKNKINWCNLDPDPVIWIQILICDLNRILIWIYMIYRKTPVSEFKMPWFGLFWCNPDPDPDFWCRCRFWSGWTQIRPNIFARKCHYLAYFAVIRTQIRIFYLDAEFDQDGPKYT